MSCSGVLSLTQHGMNRAIFSAQGHDRALAFWRAPEEEEEGEKRPPRREHKERGTDRPGAVDKLSE